LKVQRKGEKPLVSLDFHFMESIFCHYWETCWDSFTSRWQFFSKSSLCSCVLFKSHWVSSLVNKTPSLECTIIQHCITQLSKSVAGHYLVLSTIKQVKLLFFNIPFFWRRTIWRKRATRSTTKFMERECANPWEETPTTKSKWTIFRNWKNNIQSITGLRKVIERLIPVEHTFTPLWIILQEKGCPTGLFLMVFVLVKCISLLEAIIVWELETHVLKTLCWLVWLIFKSKREANENNYHPSF